MCCIYNGREKLKHDILRLSDAFEMPFEGISLEIVANVINVNHDSGEEVLNKSESLRGYSYLTELIRIKTTGDVTRDRAIKLAIDQCIAEDVLKSFLQENYEEVANMLGYEYKMEDEFAAKYEDGLEKGIFESARKMLRSGMLLQDVAKILELSDEHIRELKGVLA